MPNFGEIFQRIFSVNLRNDKSFIQTDIYTAQESVVEEYLAPQTDTVLLSPSSGHKIVVTGFSLHSKADVGEVRLEFSDGSLIAKLYSERVLAGTNAGNFVIRGKGEQDILVQGGEDAFIVSLNFIEVEV